jgi:hypothetical protein
MRRRHYGQTGKKEAYESYSLHEFSPGKAVGSDFSAIPNLRITACRLIILVWCLLHYQVTTDHRLH